MQPKPLECVARTGDLPEGHLSHGQVGAIVERLAPDVLFVEFCDNDGPTERFIVLRTEWPRAAT